jgi:hypothetical protein
MARHKDPNLERLWRQRLRRQSITGLSVAAFCSREGVTLASFYYWKRRLSAPREPTSRPALFVPVRVQDGPHEFRPRVACGVEIELPHRVRLRLEVPPEPE